MKARNKYLGALLLSMLLLSGCLFDEEFNTQHITKDFNLCWFGEKRNQSLCLNSDHFKYGGAVIISETVFALGFNENFMIAKQHPNKEEELTNRLFNRDTLTGDYILERPEDTIWLSEPDSVYQKNGKYYHISNGWNPPRSLFPYRDSTYYYIIDLRGYKTEKDWNRGRITRLATDSAFQSKRRELDCQKIYTSQSLNRI